MEYLAAAIQNLVGVFYVWNVFLIHKNSEQNPDFDRDQDYASDKNFADRH